MKKNFLVLIGFCMLGSFMAEPLTKRKVVADKKSSSLMYSLHHTLHSFEASAKDFNCIAVFNDESQQLEIIAVKAAINSFDSGNSNRDSHVIEATEALKYPSVTFSAEELVYNGQKVTANGKLVFHGVTKPFSISGEQKIENGKLSIYGRFEVDMTAFGIKPPSLVGMATDEILKMSYMFNFDI